MSGYFIDGVGDKFWYEAKSDTPDYTENIIFPVSNSDFIKYMYIRPHRLDGPAIERHDGTECYCINGRYHREDGPAIIRSNGCRFWYLNSIEYSFKEWYKKLNKTQKEISDLKIKYNMGKFLITTQGTKIWHDLKSDIQDYKRQINFFVTEENNSSFYVRLHNEDGPAIIYADGSEVYCIKGKIHREDGPAVIMSNGYVQWLLNDVIYTFDDWCKKLNKSEEEISELKKKYNI